MLRSADGKVCCEVVAYRETAARRVDRGRREPDLASILFHSVVRRSGGNTQRGLRQTLGGGVAPLPIHEDRQACGPRHEHRRGNRASALHDAIPPTNRSKTECSSSVSTMMVIVAGPF